jgi:hypothetical protein
LQRLKSDGVRLSADRLGFGLGFVRADPLAGWEGERRREEESGAALNGEMKESDSKLEAVCFFIEEDVPKYHSFALYLQNNHCLGLPQSWGMSILCGQTGRVIEMVTFDFWK